jgi:hypothetical protein
MADGMLPYDTGGYKFPFVFAVVPWTENLFSGLRTLTRKANSNHGLMTDITLGNFTAISQIVQFILVL